MAHGAGTVNCACAAHIRVRVCVHLLLGAKRSVYAIGLVKNSGKDAIAVTNHYELALVKPIQS